MQHSLARRLQLLLGTMTRKLALLLPALLLIPLLGCTPETGASGTPEGPPEATSLTVELPVLGHPEVNGAPQTPVTILGHLDGYEDPPPTTIRLLPGTAPARLWELWSLLASELPEERLESLKVELPVASENQAGENLAGDMQAGETQTAEDRPETEFRSFEDPPPFIVLFPEEVQLGRDGTVPQPLGSLEELIAVAAHYSVREPSTPVVLMIKNGVDDDRREQAIRWLQRGQAEKVYLFEKEGLRPLKS